MRKTAYSLLVPKSQWRSTKIYCYCPSCDEVFGIAKDETPACPTCGRFGCWDIFSEIHERVSTIWQFYEAMRVQEGLFGRFRETGSPYPYSLNATYHALEKRLILMRYGFEAPYTPEQVSEWVETILLDINEESGLIEDPFLAQEKGRSQQFLDGMYNLSNRLQNVFTQMGLPEAYRVPLKQRQERDPLPDRESALQWLHNELWDTNPWGKGAQTVYAVQIHEEVLQRTNQPDDGMTDFVHQWLDDHQDPHTGYWFGAQSTANNRACGAYKLICWLYRPRNWPINHLEKVVDTTLALQSPRGDFGDDGFSCQVFDPLLLLKMGFDRLGDYRREEIYEAAARCFLNVKDHWSDEHHTFAFDVTRPTMIDLLGVATVVYMAELLLGIPVFDEK